MPNFLNTVMAVAEEQGPGITFSQAKKTARRLERREDAAHVVDEYAYVLQYWDETGETATDHYDTQRERNRIAAAQRISRTHRSTP